MPTRDILRRLVEIQKWDSIPKKDKYGKVLWLYYRNGKKYNKALFITYQEDDDNVLLRFPNSAFFKKYKKSDKIYIDPIYVFIKDMKKMVKGWKPPMQEEPKIEKRKKETKEKETKKTKTQSRVLLNF